MADHAELFENYTKVKPLVPPAVWMALRLVTLAITVLVIVALFVDPQLGLRLFWGITVPTLPGLFAFAPGFWRQICPMAFLNQMPRMGRFTLGRTLPERLRFWSYLIAVTLLLSMISIRMPILNVTGTATAVMCIVALVLAFAGGVIFKGRSGWCGTFCPLAPVQRTHGQAPLITVRNGYCPTCVGCQKNCYDFNPRAAIFADLSEEDPRHAGQRVLFTSMLPGLIWAFYTQGQHPSYDYAHYMEFLIISALTCTGAFYLLRALMKQSNYRIVTIFGVVALLTYYWFAGPVLTTNVLALFNVVPSDWLLLASQFIAVPIAIGLGRKAAVSEQVLRRLKLAATQPRVNDGQISTAPDGGAVVEERKSGKRFTIKDGQTLLEGMEGAGISIAFGCRAGLCGADAVCVLDGMDNLEPPGADESATLGRMGLEGKGRLACCAKAKGPLTITTDLKAADSMQAAPRAAAGDQVDAAAAAAIRHVVIIGNGIAGITVAETLRRASPSVEISIVADETHHFYNRMSIGRMIYDRGGMDGLQLVPDAWYKDNRVTVWLNTIATAIQREEQKVVLGTGDVLAYDRLVIATGARAAAPEDGFEGKSNAFVLRSAEDAKTIRAVTQRNAARSAVVIGGGVLGVEAAEALSRLGLPVTILHRGPRLMERQIDAVGAKILAEYLGAKRIDAVLNCAVAAYEGDGAISGVRLKDGTVVKGDLFIACAGIRPNADLAKAAGLEVGNGIKVSATLQTSDPHIFAVGDVAEPPSGGGGLWPVAVAQGRAAVDAMLARDGAGIAPHYVLHLKSDGIDLRSFGSLSEREGSEVFTAKSGAASWWRVIVHDGQITGAVHVGPPRSSDIFLKLMQQKDGGALPKARPHLAAGNIEALEKVL